MLLAELWYSWVVFRAGPLPSSSFQAVTTAMLPQLLVKLTGLAVCQVQAF